MSDNNSSYDFLMSKSAGKDTTILVTPDDISAKVQGRDTSKVFAMLKNHLKGEKTVEQAEEVNPLKVEEINVAKEKEQEQRSGTEEVSKDDGR